MAVQQGRKSECVKVSKEKRAFSRTTRRDGGRTEAAEIREEGNALKRHPCISLTAHASLHNRERDETGTVSWLSDTAAGERGVLEGGRRSSGRPQCCQQSETQVRDSLGIHCLPPRHLFAHRKLALNGPANESGRARKLRLGYGMSLYAPRVFSLVRVLLYDGFRQSLAHCRWEERRSRVG